MADDVTLTQINKNILTLNKEVEEMKEKLDEISGYLREDYELAHDLKSQIGQSIKRPKSEFISHDVVKKRFL